MTIEDAIIKEFDEEFGRRLAVLEANYHIHGGEGWTGKRTIPEFIRDALAKYKAELLDRVIARCLNEKGIHLEENTDFVESIDQVISDLSELKGKK